MNKNVVIKAICAREDCDNEFDRTSNRRLYCSTKCRFKTKHELLKKRLENNAEYKEIWRQQRLESAKKYNRIHPDRVLAARRKVAKVIDVGLEIRNKSLNQSGWGTKSLWNGEGEWHKDYDFCQECGTTVYKHCSFGVCLKCYGSLRYQNLSPEDKKRLRKKFNKVSYFTSTRRKEALKWIDKAKNGEIAVDSTITNLLSNL